MAFYVRFRITMTTLKKTKTPFYVQFFQCFLNGIHFLKQKEKLPEKSKVESKKMVNASSSVKRKSYVRKQSHAPLRSSTTYHSPSTYVPHSTTATESKTPVIIPIDVADGSSCGAGCDYGGSSCGGYN
ncbi:unnamed protein product [Didymodactylos carnosus]|uniref:Uncharacterized protein n=1 Tax=Didymodactylos carnosus TaxID=1234261 RepID=A0A814WKV0_9BILA|nr:unnamed protein product [Didymodactylos carnosus]CAF3967994.1 unnamed protein product [Didymodactylos carnosus]